jgi:dipeptidyl aminopeptidase/acylaminoacyl peptidase
MSALADEHLAGEVAGRPVAGKPAPGDVTHEAPIWREWVTAPGSWAPDLSPDGRWVAFVNDCSGIPRAWVALAAGSDAGSGAGELVELPTGRDHAEAVAWSADGEWIAVLGAPGGEATRTRVWVVRPDGSDARRVAGVRSGTAAFGPWLRSGAVLPLSVSGRRPEETSSTLLDVNTGVSRPLGYGAVFTVMDLRHDAGAALVRIGPRGQRTLVVVHLESGTTTELVPAGEGMTDQGFFMPDGRVLARSNFGREDYVLVELEAGRTPRVLATHPGGELDTFAVTADGARAALVWNVGGRSELELMELGSDERLRVGGPDVIDQVRFSADGSRLVVAGQGSRLPRALWQVELNPLTTRLVPVPTPDAPVVERRRLVTPTRELVDSGDGFTIEGWLYRPPGIEGPVPTVIHLHGGPEAQDRPGYAALFQALVAEGMAVFAPNVRGSTGYGRSFECADDGPLRYGAISDVAACALHLLRTGVAQPGRLACAGRSYGGYLTLAALTFHPELFAAGVDICGMSDLLTFYKNTEAWIAAVAIPKYGDPVRDADLLADLSPLRRFHRLRAPLLVVHGMNDRNVPVTESSQAIDVARAKGIDAELLLFPDEGHEIVGHEGKLRFVTAVVDFLGHHLQRAPVSQP